MLSDEKRNYEIGYGKPPIHTRFQRGQSGNPRGKPAGAKTLKTLVSEALNQLVVINEDGRQRKVTKREAIATKLVDRSASADFRAIKILLDVLRDIEGRGEETSAETSSFSAADEKVMAQLRERLSKGQKE
jgi:hypothetical protein